MGIPKGTKLADNPKNKTIKIRIDESTSEKLNYLASEQNSDRSKIVRKSINRQYGTQKIIIIKNTKDKKYRIYGFYAAKENENAIKEEIKKFNSNPLTSYHAQLYNISSDFIETEMVHILHESMDIINYECSNDCPIPDITKYTI